MHKPDLEERRQLVLASNQVLRGQKNLHGNNAQPIQGTDSWPVKTGNKRPSKRKR